MNMIGFGRFKCVFAAVFAMAGVHTLWAAKFPSAGGDIADISAWGGAIPDDAEFNQEGTYTASTNVSFNTLKISGGNNTFSMAGKKIGIKKSIYSSGTSVSTSLMNGFTLDTSAGGTTQTFSGGIYEMTNSYLGVFKYGTSGGPLGATMIFRDGAVVTNLCALGVAGPYTDTAGSTIRFTGEGTALHIAKSDALASKVKIGNTSKAGFAKGRLEILDGANFYCGTAFYFDGDATDTKPHPVDYEFLVSGAGSKVVLDAPMYMGWGWNMGNRLTIDDHAEFTSLNGTFALGYGGNTAPAISNIVTVKNGASLSLLAATVNLGSTAARAAEGHSYGNQLRVLDGATARVKSIVVSVGSASTTTPYAPVYDLGDATHDNGVLVSNATLTVTNSLNIGSGNYSTNNWVEILDGSALNVLNLNIGVGNTSAWNSVRFDSSMLNLTNYCPIGYGVASRESVFVATNSVIRSPQYFSAGSGNMAFSNRLTVVGGLLATPCVYSGNGRTNRYNTVELVGPMTAAVSNYYVSTGYGCEYNRLVLSNQVSTFGSGFFSGYMTNAVGNRVEMFGVSNDTGTRTLSLTAGYAPNAVGNSFYVTNSTFVGTDYMYLRTPIRDLPNASSNRIEIVDSTFTSTKARALRFEIGDGPNCVGNEAIFRDVTLPEADYMYLGGRDCRLTLDNTPVTILGYSGLNGNGNSGASTNATVLITGPRSVLTMRNSAGVWYWGGWSNDSRARSASLTVADGAEVRLETATGEVATERPVRVGVNGDSYGHKLAFRNASMTCDVVELHGEACEFEIGGADAHVTLARTGATHSIFQDAVGCVYRLTDGARLAPTSCNMYFTWNTCVSHDNQFIVEKKAVLDLDGCQTAKGERARNFTVGYSNTANQGQVYDNTLLVQSGGVITNADSISLSYMPGCRLVIDDGQVYCVSVPMLNRETDPGDGNMIVIKGPNSRLVLSNKISTSAGYENGIRFEVPAGGYTAAPIKTSTVEMGSSGVLQIDLSKLLAGFRAHKERISVNLIESTSAMTIPQATLDAAIASVNSQLAAANCRGSLTLSSDRKTLTLKAVPRVGLYIVFQ